MAAPPAQQQTTDINATTYVAKDMIWKAYIGKADIAAKSWNENWGFLVEEEVQTSESKSSRSSAISKSSLADRKTSFYTDKSHLFPKTASQMVGWRSTNPVLQLERFGKYANGKNTITKSLKWPNEGVV